MNSRIDFVKTIVQEYIENVHPEEEEFLKNYLGEVESSDFKIDASGNSEIPFGFGGDELLQMFQSPLVIKILSSLWKDILTPLYVEILKKHLGKDQQNKVSDKVLQKISRNKLKEYILKQAKKKMLTDEEADDLAGRVVEWIRRHPEEIMHINSSSK